MALIKFLRGAQAKYNAQTHQDSIYFATDAGLLYLNGKLYGGKVNDVSIEGYILTVTLTDGTKTTINLLEVLPTATVDSKGLLSKEDKAILNQLSANETNGKYAEKTYVDDTFVTKETYGACVEAHAEQYGALSTALSEEIERAGAAEKANADAIAVEKGRIDLLIGSDVPAEGESQMSIRAIVQDEVASQLDSENISDSFDTLREMAEWLSSHPEDVQEMNDAIAANAEAIEALQGTVSDNLDAAKDYTDQEVGKHATAVTEALALKVDVVEGKGLSTNDYTDEEKTKLASLKVVDVDTTAVNGISLKLDQGKVAVGTVDVKDLTTALVAEELTGLKVKVGQAITGTDVVAANSVASAIEAIALKVKSIDETKVTSVTGDSYISASKTGTGVNLALSVRAVGNALVDNSSAIKVNSETGALTLEWEEVE